MTSSQPSWRSIDAEYRRQMTSLPFPVENAHAHSALPLLYPMLPEVCCGGEDGQGQVVLVVAMPAAQRQHCVEELTTTRSERRLDDVAEDLTTRCCNSELHPNEGLSRETDSERAVATRNPVFGKSKSPKSYWLRRHSDSVFAGAARGLAPSCDEPASSAEHASRHSKERAASDSRSVVKEFDATVLIDDRKPPAHWFQSMVVGMQCSGDSDEVFDEAPAVQSPHPDVEVDSEELTATHSQLEHCNSVHCYRGRLAVASTGDLEDIDEENQSPDLDENDDGGMVDSSTPAKHEQPLSDSVRSMELSGDPPGQSAEEATRHDDDVNRKLMNGEREVATPEAAVVQRRASRVVRSPRPAAASVESSSGSDATAAAGGGKVHRCAVCRRTFSRSDMLERHARLHTGVRPYACRLCTQVFSRSDHLTTHLRTHTGEKPYACPRCAYTASRRDMVTRHLRVHQSTPAAVELAVAGVVGPPPRRRIYRSRYKERSSCSRSTAIQRHDVDVASSRSSPLERQCAASLDEGTRYVRSAVDGAALSWPGGAQLRDLPLPSSSAPASCRRRRLEHLQALHALSRSVVARGSTGSTDSYSSPGCLSASDVFEFAAGGGAWDASPDVFRSPSAARQSSVFLFTYNAPPSTAVSVCDPADSF